MNQPAASLPQCRYFERRKGGPYSTAMIYEQSQLLFFYFSSGLFRFHRLLRHVRRSLLCLTKLPFRRTRKFVFSFLSALQFICSTVKRRAIHSAGTRKPRFLYGRGIFPQLHNNHAAQYFRTFDGHS